MRWRTVGRVAVTVLVGLLVPAAVAAVGIARATGEIYISRDAAAPPVPIEIAPPPYDRSKPTAVMVLGSEGVRWQDGVRYVDDGDVITSAGVLSGVDGALRLVERMLGEPAARQAAQAVDWPDYSPGGPVPIPQYRLAPADVVGLLGASYRWDRPNMGVLLTDGVGEIELASAFRQYTVLSYLARPVAVTADGQPIRSRHGLTFVPRADLTTAAPRLNRRVVPGADAARHADGDGLFLPERLAPIYLHDQPGFGFDAALRDIARTRDVATAHWVAKTLQYPATNPQLSGPAWPWTLTLRPILIAAAAATAAALIIQLFVPPSQRRYRWTSTSIMISKIDSRPTRQGRQRPADRRCWSWPTATR